MLIHGKEKRVNTVLKRDSRPLIQGEGGLLHTGNRYNLVTDKESVAKPDKNSEG